jgi:hypothetical protein
MGSKSWIGWLGAGLIALAVIIAPPTPIAHAVEDAPKVSVVSFGLLGDQGVFRSEATGAHKLGDTGITNVRHEPKACDLSPW